MAAHQAPPTIPRHTDSPGPALALSDSDDDVLLLNDFGGEENDESIEAIQEAIDQMGVNQPDNEFEMAAQSGSEYAYLLAGTEEEKKRAESLIQQVHNNNNLTLHLYNQLTLLFSILQRQLMAMASKPKSDSSKPAGIRALSPVPESTMDHSGLPTAV